MIEEQLLLANQNIDLLNVKIKALEADNSELNAEIAEVIKLVREIIGVLGLLDVSGTTIKPELLSGDESVFSLLFVSLGDIMGLITKSNMPILGKKYTAKLADKFRFVEGIIPLIQKYSNNS